MMCECVCVRAQAWPYHMCCPHPWCHRWCHQAASAAGSPGGWTAWLQSPSAGVLTQGGRGRGREGDISRSHSTSLSADQRCPSPPQGRSVRERRDGGGGGEGGGARVVSNQAAIESPIDSSPLNLMTHISIERRLTDEKLK